MSKHEDDPDGLYIAFARNSPFDTSLYAFGSEMVEGETRAEAHAEALTLMDAELLIDVLTLDETEALLRTNLWAVPDGTFAMDGVWGYNWVSKSFEYLDSEYCPDTEERLEESTNDEIKAILTFEEVAILLCHLRAQLFDARQE